LAPKPLLYYISGHGYGHATRSTAVIEAIQQLQPDRTIFVRTCAPDRIFPASVRYGYVELDSGVVETNRSLGVDRDATIYDVRRILARADDLIRREVQFIRDHRIGQVVADIPFLAGEIADAAGVDCIGIGNFTWDWIYEPYAPSDILDRIALGHSRMKAYLRLPFSHESRLDAFPRVEQMGLLARKSRMSREEARQAFGLPENDSRTCVLVAMRALVGPESLAAAVHGSPSYLFVYMGPDPGFSAPNLHLIDPASGPHFPDLLRACDVTVSKLGYGTVSECIANGCRLLFPRRIDFREDEIMEPQVLQTMRAVRMDPADFDSGRWGSYLSELMAVPEPAFMYELNGAEQCAAVIAH
jgi:L-arabinokinase